MLICTVSSSEETLHSLLQSGLSSSASHFHLRLQERGRAFPDPTHRRGTGDGANVTFLLNGTWQIGKQTSSLKSILQYSSIGEHYYFLSKHIQCFDTRRVSASRFVFVLKHLPHYLVGLTGQFVTCSIQFTKQNLNRGRLDWDESRGQSYASLPNYVVLFCSQKWTL